MSNSHRHNFRRPHHLRNQGHQSRSRHAYPHPSQYHQSAVFPPPPQHHPEWSNVPFPPPPPPPPDFGPPDSHWMTGFHPHPPPGPGMGPPNPWVDPPPHQGYDPHLHNNSFFDPHQGPVDHRRNFSMHRSFHESGEDTFFQVNEQEGGYSKRPRRSDPEMMMMMDTQGFHPANNMDHNPTLDQQRGSPQDARSRSDHHGASSSLIQNLGRLHAPLRPMVDVNKKLDTADCSMTVSILSYNLLAQDLIHKNMYLYDSHEPDVLSWDYRKINLFVDLRGSKADILCLQEVQRDHYETWFEPELAKHDYCGLYQCRTGSHNDGCAIFYRKSRLKLIEWTGLQYRKNVKVLNRDNVGIVAKFCPLEKSDSEMFCVATTHLLYNPKAGEVKLAQISCLLAELHNLATIPGRQGLLPSILCGDFNCTPNSPFLDFIASSSMDYSKLSAATIAGYFDEHRKSRPIPIPLLPENLNIGSNCMYTNVQPHEMKQTGVSDSIKTSSSVASNSVIERRSNKEDVSSLQLQTKGDGSVMLKEDGAKKALGNVSNSHLGSILQNVPTLNGTEFVAQQNEEFKQVERPSYRTRSARGARARGTTHKGAAGLSRSTSMLSATRDLKHSHESQSPSMEWEAKQTNNGQQQQQTTETKMTMVAQCVPSPSVEKTRLSDIKQTKNHQPVPGVLTHPFNFESAYPYLPSSVPSTVTTYHQSAFETVDYIFYTPVTSTYGCTSGFHLLTRKVLPSTHTLLDLGPQPHKFLSSDHLSLQAVFQLVWKEHT